MGITIALGILLFFGLFWLMCPAAPGALARPFNILTRNIWGPETNKIRLETLERVRQLYIDEDVPAESAVLMATKEDGVSEEELYAACKAIDAKDLVDILTGSNRSRLRAMARVIAKKAKYEKR